MAIRLIADSASDISPVQAAQRNIQLLPMTVSFGDETFRDGVDLSPKAFYEKLIETDELPTTSQIPPYVFEEAFRQALAEGDTPVVITVSSELSGTYQSACIAASEFEDGQAFVVDSRSASLGEAILVEYAHRLVEQGLSAKALVDELNRAKTRIRLMALLDTLEYLKKGGRISSAVALAGSLLSIKPVVAIEDGKVAMAGKARGSKQGNNLLSELVSKKGVDFDMPFSLAYTGLDSALLRKYVADSKRLWEGKTDELPVLVIGATIGTHIGPGAVGVAFFEQE